MHWRHSKIFSGDSSWVGRVVVYESKDTVQIKQFGSWVPIEQPCCRVWLWVWIKLVIKKIKNKPVSLTITLYMIFIHSIIHMGKSGGIQITYHHTCPLLFIHSCFYCESLNNHYPWPCHSAWDYTTMGNINISKIFHDSHCLSLSPAMLTQVVWTKH